MTVFALESFVLSDWMVAGLGLAAVFIGLVCIIALCTIVSKLTMLVNNTDKLAGKADASSATAPAPASAAPSAVGAPAADIVNKEQVVAAIAAAIAEDMGTDVKALRILSLKRV